MSNLALTSSFNVYPVTRHVVMIPAQEAKDANPAEIMKATGYSPYRYGQESVLCLDVPPSKLTEDDIVAINELCDQHEPAKNRQVKRDISAALMKHFNGDKPLKVVEMGCGHFPIADYLPETKRIGYHGIEIDRHAIEDLSKAGYSVSDWSDALFKHTAKPGETSVSVGVYSLQFMVNPTLPMKLKLMNSPQDGFFVGNFYSDPIERHSGAQRRALKDILSSSCLHFQVLKDPTCPSSEYWVIGRQEAARNISSFTQTLKAQINPTPMLVH